MKYRIDFRFWGSTQIYTRVVENANIRDYVLRDLRASHSITYIGVSKLLKNGTIKPMFSEIR